MDFDSYSLIDISPLISPEIAVFPGDTPFSQEFLMDTNSGDHISLSKITTTVHLGAHADSPYHYGAHSPSMEMRSLNYYWGPAQVIEVKKPRGTRITAQDLQDVEIKASRILFKTLSFPNPHQWNSDFVSLSGELVDFLAERKVCLVGIDTPSIDLADDKILQSHQAVHRHDMAILEGIVLDSVAPGLYQLVALPLKLKNADASPVRAVLLKKK